VVDVAVRACAGAVAVAMLTVASAACANGSDAERAATTTMTTVAAPESTTVASCETPVPAAWQKAIDESAVDTGGVSNVPMAVGRQGEIAVSRDDGGTRDVLLIGADKSISEIYEVREPDENQVGSVALDDRWVVVGVVHSPRGANGVLPTLMRVDVIDRQGGAERTVVESPPEDLESGGKTIDSFTLFGGKVYWITRDTYPGDSGTIRSYDLNTGAVTDVASGEMRNVRTTAAGLSWEVAWDQAAGTRTELKIPDALPPAVAGALGTGRDQFTLATDGNVYAWATGTTEGEHGLAYWSPKAGLVRITGKLPAGGKNEPLPLQVVGSYVVIERGRDDGRSDTSAAIVDTRSGAVTYLRPSVGGANGGSVALGLGAAAKEPPTSAGVIRIDALPPLTC
jgi:hypothetical protein